MSRWLVACAVTVAVLSSATLASAQNPLIRQGQEQYDELRFEEALQTLSAALVRSGNTPQQYATIYRLLAFTYLALGREEEASGAYRSMLPLDPEHALGDEVAPRIRTFFQNVRDDWEAAGRPGIERPVTSQAQVAIRHRSPPEAERETEVPLSAEVDDPDGRVSSLVLAYRQGTDAVFTRLDTQRQSDGSFRATIPADAVAPPLVEYYFEALDADGLPVAARGDVAAPLRIAVPEPGGNVLEEWWFWTIIGVVVVGGVVGGIIIADQLSNQGPATGTFVITVE
ncbi:MAG: tetratricopeptide repeat protein [Myxococcales bacterium]|nr:tetratricopeptide repeat protein [Myxococcales bacterium]